MAIFSKKQCDACGGKIGLLGNRKLEDGNICKDCNNKLSPWFAGRRNTSLEEIKEQLEYRKENEKRLEGFNVSKRLGVDTMILVDYSMEAFIISFTGEIEDNPDIIPISDVLSCNMDINESKTELKQLDKNGMEVSYMIRRYEYHYDFHITINLKNPYFETIEFNLNSFKVDSQSRHGYDLYREAGENICALLNGESADMPINLKEELKAPDFCPECGAAVAHKEAVFCQSCGINFYN